MKKGSTIFLRGVIIFIGLGVLALAIFALPSVYKGGSAEFPEASQALLFIVTLMYLSAIPFYIALGQTLKLLSYIDKNKAFSDLGVKALKNIKYCAIAVSACYFVIVPLLFPVADADDAPGLLLMGAVIACAPIVIAVFAAVLQKLLQNAIDIKAENDLTV